ncbi:MAG: nucleotide exchange factor GrpE [Patescibacteria group bacterium]|jgi:molecular chaperone GrpE
MKKSIDDTSKQIKKHKKENEKAGIKELKQELQDTQQKWLRAVADYQNLERRLQKEREEWVKFSNVNLLNRILDAIDQMDRAAVFVKDPGLEMIRKSFKDILHEFGVEELEIEGKEFDPALMECVDKKQGKENKVLEVAQKGYKLHDRVLRPAKVVVGSSQNSNS